MPWTKACYILSFQLMFLIMCSFHFAALGASERITEIETSVQSQAHSNTAKENMNYSDSNFQISVYFFVPIKHSL